jgi:methyl-accepting chemotaxis protein
MKAVAATILQLDNLANDVAVAVRQQDTVTREIARNASGAAKGARDVSANITEVSSTAEARQLGGVHESEPKRAFAPQ